MRLWQREYRSALVLVPCLLLQSVLACPAQAQYHVPRGVVPCPPQPCPTPPGYVAPVPQMMPQPAVPGTMPQPEVPPTQQPEVPPAQQETSIPVPQATLGLEQASAAEAESFAAPNMLGHLLYASRSLNFRYNRAAGLINVANNGSTSIVNAAVADNNSPIPRDRFSFRYNHFQNSQSVTGFGPPVFDAQGVGTSFAQTRDYNVDAYTFQFEKTFLCGAASVELRLPFSTTLSPDLNLSAGDITGPVLGAGGQQLTTPTGAVFAVNSTPGQTLGSEATRFGNVTLIFKGLGYSGPAVAVSGGLAVGIPTGPDTKATIVDYSGGTGTGNATIQRERVIRVDNETWSLSPFLAFLATPTERVFTQGFAQLSLPINSSGINYTDRYTRGTVPALPSSFQRFPTLNPPFAVGTDIREQSLLHLNWGVGYWLLRDPSRSWLTGFAPTLELHYTTTLQNAQVVALPADSLLQIDPTNPRRSIQEAPPRVGNLGNRIDIFDVTAGATFLFSDRATMAFGLSLPMNKGDNRTFDWEAQVQFNYYFGGIGGRGAPNF